MRDRLRTTSLWHTAEQGRGRRSRLCSRGTCGLITAAALAACGSSATPPPEPSHAAAPARAPSAPTYLTYDRGARTVHVALVAGYDQTAGRNFDGHSKGSLGFTIPAGWSVTVDCTNGDPTEHHSCAVVSDASATNPAFAGATTPNPLNGLGYRDSATFTFTPNVTGTYRFACLVGHHELSGMWDALTVTSSGRPSAST
jgi:hypothetical protein